MIQKVGKTFSSPFDKIKPLQVTSTEIADQKERLAEFVTNQRFELQTEPESQSSKVAKEKCKQDCLFQLSYLAEAVRIERVEVFTAYLHWAKTMMNSANIPVENLVASLHYLDFACREILSPDINHIVNGYITEGVNSLKLESSILPASFLQHDNPLLPFAKEYLLLLLDGKRGKAQALIDTLVKDGQSITSIYEYIFEATQYELGLLWQTNKISVANEHYCTAATQQIMSSLYPFIFNTREKKYKMMGCTVSGSLHELGIRMISDFFEKDGWDTYYMGASMPDEDIVRAAKEQRTDVLAISVSMSFDIRKVETLVRQIRTDETFSNLKIIVGGPPFNEMPDLWKRVGADGWAKNARHAVKLANNMMSDKKSTL